MGCSSCGQSMSFPIVESITRSIAGSGTNCQFTADQLTQWQTLLLCVKANRYYTQFSTTEGTVNAALGTVASALGQRDNLCYYKIELDKYINLVQIIQFSGICN